MIFGVLLIAGAVCFWCNARSSLRKTEDIISLEQQLDALPDHDYIAEIRQLIKDNGTAKLSSSAKMFKKLNSHALRKLPL